MNDYNVDLPMRLPGGAVTPAINDTTGLALGPFICKGKKSDVIK